MSSEMRELVRAELRAARDTEDGVNRVMALLARTEAVADGAVPLWISCHWRENLARDSVVSVVNRQDSAHTLQVYVSTHPQDASGDAEAAYEILDRLTTTREGCLQLAKVIYRELDKVEKLLDEAVEKCAAMQAKEAK